MSLNVQIKDANYTDDGLVGDLYLDKNGLEEFRKYIDVK